jgi:hypothetical protein
LSMLSKETDPDVRLRLYQALGNQQSFDYNTLMAGAGKESDPSARVTLFDALAKALRDNPSTDLQSFFLQTAIPELKLIALNGLSADDRQAAIIALMRARTPEALAALTDLQSQLAQMQNAQQSQPVSEPPQNNSPRSHRKR